LAKHRRRFTKAFKREAVELVTKRDYTVSQAASSLGISRGTLGKWRQDYLASGEDAFPGTGHQSADMEELRRLREENKKLRMEKEILKKAAAFFAKEFG
jgi:transposase